MREINLHLTVEAREDDPRSDADIAEAVLDSTLNVVPFAGGSKRLSSTPLSGGRYRTIKTFRSDGLVVALEEVSS